MQNERSSEVDIARGLAMLVIVGWHVYNIHSPLTDGWTMPIFFIIMGMFYKQETSFNILLTKKFNTIVIPWLFYSIPAFFICLYQYDFLYLIKLIINPYECIHGGNWFLICILWCYVFNFIIHKYIKKKELVLLSCFFVSGISFILSHLHLFGYRIVFPFYISASMVCMIFISIGELIKPYLLGQRKLPVLLLTMSLFIIDVILFQPTPLDLPWMNFPSSYILFVLNAVLGSCAIIYLCKYISSYVIKFIGRYSLLFLLLHSYIITIFKGNIDDDIVYVLVVIVSVIICKFCVKTIPYVSGIKPLI